MKSISALLSTLILLTACSQAQKSAEEEAGDPQAGLRKIFEEGNQLMDAGQYLQAAKTFEKANIVTPVSMLEGVVLYNTAISYQLAGDCKQAYPGFRRVVDFASKDRPSLAVRAKHRLGETLSCIGQDQKAIVVLVETFRQRNHLEPASRAELPARIAALYARIGQKALAAKYLAVAEKSLAQLGSNRELLAQTLFYMGDVTTMVNAELEWRKVLSTYATFKSYLIRSAALGQTPWSAKAIDSVKKAFDQLWQLHSAIRPDPSAKDRTLAIRNAKVERRELLKGLLAQIVASQNLLTPRIAQNPTAIELNSLLKKEELKVKNELASETVGAENTEEAKKLDAIRREGRVKSAEPSVLEKQKQKEKPKK